MSKIITSKLTNEEKDAFGDRCDALLAMCSVFLSWRTLNVEQMNTLTNLSNVLESASDTSLNSFLKRDYGFDFDRNKVHVGDEVEHALNTFVVTAIYGNTFHREDTKLPVPGHLVKKI